MTEQDGKDSKIIRLFPGKKGQAPAERPGGDPDGPDSAEPEAVRQTIAGILGEADPLPAPQPSGPMPPPPGHPKAKKCPQCEVDVWRDSRHCWRCQLDLVEYAQAQAYRRQRRRDIIWRCILVGSWAVAGGCVYVMNHYYRYLPPKVRGAMFITVLVIVGVNLFLLWMNSEDNRRR